jgi:hypothetical protein
MTSAFINSFESEWIKKRRSLASWLVFIGAFFTPTFIVAARVFYPERLARIYSSQTFWIDHWRSCWESIAIFLLPMGIVLATSLITQLEYKNNTWKQVHTLPLRHTTIYFSKLAVIVVMMLQFFLLFNIGIVMSAMIPPLLFGETILPLSYLDVQYFLLENVYYFIDCLPIIALQYLVAINFKNFLVPIGGGFLLWVASIATLSWRYGYALPYSYTMINFLKMAPGKKVVIPDFNFHLMAAGYFGAFVVVGYFLYINKKEKG